MSHIKGCFRSDGDWFCAAGCPAVEEERVQGRIAAAIAAERERCVRIVEAVLSECEYTPCGTAAYIAARIRSGEPAPGDET
jgi:hypothetical protein